MLILQRKKGESIVINENIRVTVVESGSDWVKLAVDAPREISVLRSELLDAALANREATSQENIPFPYLEELLNRKRS